MNQRAILVHMKSTSLLILGLSFAASWASAAVPSKSVSQKSQNTPVVKESDKNFQRDRELVLRKKNEIERRVPQALPTETEKKVYEELVQAYERNDELSFQSRFQKMMADYPRGVYADEVLYLSGMMAFTNKLYGRALKSFDQVLKDYPRSNRSRAALYAKAAVYRKINLTPQAISAFSRVKQLYPGSPEARRADVDLKVLR